MWSDEELDRCRLEEVKIRVMRDADEKNDIRGYVVAWDDESLLIRKPNRKVVKIPRSYRMMPADEPRPDL